MIHIIEGPPGPKASLLDSMFEDRKRLFVDLLGWEVPVVGDRHEIDPFDDHHAIYLVVEEHGMHHGSLRLLPTDRPHLLASLFAHLCPFGVPAGTDILEITRLCLPQRLGAETRLEVRNMLISAMVDHCVARGVKRLVGFVEAPFREKVLTMGWLAEPLGPIVRQDNAAIGAFQLHIDETTPERLRWTGIYRTSALADVEELAA